MNTLSIQLNKAQDTENFGQALGRHVVAGDLIYLDGDLGAGKTTLSQAIARGLGVPASCYVTSPSFAIFHEYPGRLPMYHMDFYRLDDQDDVIDLGFDEYFYQEGLCVIEWAERANDILPETGLHLHIEIRPDTTRCVHCSFKTDVWSERLNYIFVECGLTS